MTDDIDQSVDNVQIISVHAQDADIQSDILLDTQNFTACLHLVPTDDTQLVRRDNDMTLVAIGNIAPVSYTHLEISC